MLGRLPVSSPQNTLGTRKRRRRQLRSACFWLCKPLLSPRLPNPEEGELHRASAPPRRFTTAAGRRPLRLLSRVLRLKQQ